MYYNGEDVLKKRLEIRDNIAKSLGIEGGYDEIEKAHDVGDIHPNGKWVWKEYKPGKFDWRVIKGVGKKASTASRGGQRKASKSKKENKPEDALSIHSYLDNPKFDLSSDQKKVVYNLNEALKSFMGINESNIYLSDIQRAMGWDKNKTSDIVGALVSKEVLERKVVSAMDGKDYTTYHFKDQDNMVYEPSGAEKGDIAAAGLDKPKSPREAYLWVAKMKSLAEEYCKRFDLKLVEMMPGGWFLARRATDSKNAEGKSRKKYSYAAFRVDAASGDVIQATPSERTLGQLKKKL